VGVTYNEKCLDNRKYCQLGKEGRMFECLNLDTTLKLYNSKKNVWKEREEDEQY
jgi:hypothetical protein